MEQLTDSVCLRTELRAALRELHATSRKAWEDDGYYRLDRRDAYDYFDVLPKWRVKVRTYLHSLRAAGEYVTYVDICGRATATSLGATENYSFSLQPLSPFGKSCPVAGSNGEDSRFRGDIFSARDFNRFLDMIRRNGSKPALVTFEPVAGLQSHIPYEHEDRPRLNKEVAYQILERHLRRMVALVRPGGYILLGPPFQFQSMVDFLKRKPQTEYESSLYVKALCRKMKCLVETGTTLNGPRWLIRKK